MRGRYKMMLVALSAVLLNMTPVSAQDESTPPASASKAMGSAFGVKGGVNWSNLWVKEVNDNNARFGFHVGVFARFAKPDALGFQIEALYDQKGSSVKKTFGTIDQELTYKFDYIDVPLLVVIPLGEVAEIHGGAYVGYMALSEVSSKGDLGFESNDPADSKFNGFDYGLVGGLGINLGMAQVGMRYEHGLNEIADNTSARYVLGSSKNSTLQAYLALALGK
jgi:hypothetical protein